MGAPNAGIERLLTALSVCVRVIRGMRVFVCLAGSGEFRAMAIAIGIVAFVMSLLQQPFEFIGKAPPAFAHSHVSEQILFSSAERHQSVRHQLPQICFQRLFGRVQKLT